MALAADNLELDQSGSSQGGILPSLVQFLWRRKSLILLGLVVGLVLGGLYYSQRQPVYQASAQVMVLKKAGNPLSSGANDPRQVFYDDYLSSHQVLIKSPTIVRRAVDEHQLQNLKMYQGYADPTGVIIGSLAVNRDSVGGASTNILTLSCTGTVPEDCATVVTAVIDSYKKFLDETYKNVSDDTVNQITKVTETLQKDLEERRQAYLKFQQDSPLIYAQGEGTNPHEAWLSQVQQKRLSLMVRRSEVEGRLTNLERAIQEGRGPQALADLIEASPPKPGASTVERTLEEQLRGLQVQEQMLLAEVGPHYPDVIALRRRMDRMRDLIRRETADRKDKAPAEADPPPAAAGAAQRHVTALKVELGDIDQSLQALTKMFEEEAEQARKLSKVKDEDRRYREQITTAQQAFEPIIKRLEEIKLVRDLGGYDAKIIAPAGRGGKVSPNPVQTFMAAAFLGLLAGLSLAYVAEITDKSFRNPEEIRRWLGLPVIGHIPVIRVDAETREKAAAAGSPLDPILVTVFRSKSIQSEAHRGVRTALYFSTQEGHKVVQITSPDSEDGKSTLAANLAVSMVQSGKKVLLIDADFRKPRQHKLFGVSSAVGLASVIADEAELKDAIQPTSITGLFLLPCGRRPHNPAELLTTPRFRELLAALRDEYDYILIDTPPLLAVSDPSVVAAFVDGVLLVIRVSKNGRPNAERAREILNTINARVLGVVVNGVGPNSGYNYNYQYQYGYHDEVATPEHEPGQVEANVPVNAALPGYPRGGRRKASRRGLLSRLSTWWQ